MSVLRRLPAQAFDRLLAVVVLTAAAAEVILTDGGGASLPLQLLATSGLVLPLALRRRAPLLAPAIALTVGAAMTAGLRGVDTLSAPFVVVMVFAYTTGGLAHNGTALRGLGVILVGIAAVSTAMPAGPVLGDYLFPMGFAVAAWGAGRTVRHRSRLSAEMHEAALRAEEAHRERSARAVAEERRRIAREVHDVLAHSVSVMVVQAGGARRILDRDPARAAEAARLIEQTGRAALREMRGLLGVLPEEGDGPLAPQPTLADLEALADRARAAGLEVSLRTEGEARGLPAGAEVAVYRVVQEALTNAMKHAPGARADVALRWEPGTLEIAVSDGGAVGGVRRPGLAGAGQGIVGMRERLNVYGGTVSALPRPGGGFLMRARLPLVDEHAATTPREAVL